MDDGGIKALAVDSEVFVDRSRERAKRRGKGRGYTGNHLPDHIIQKLKSLEETSLVGSVADSIFYYLSIILVGMICVVAWNANPYWGVATYLVGIVLIARQMRGIELMVHDASHWAWDRDNKTRNDVMADCIVAYPTMGTTHAYRRGHFIHHGTFAGEQDPCKRRFAEMGLGDVDLSTKWKIARAVLRWLPSYNMTYYTEIGSKSRDTLLRWATWHAVVLLVPLALIFGPTLAVAYWLLFWIVPMLVSLPVLRSIAEAEEHDYEHGETEMESTFTNDGLIHHLLWHPWNDGYHQIHHLYPNISARHHHTVHDLLMKHDPIYRQSPMRHSTLQQVHEA
jgi:fatty acid desaturase